MVDCASPHRRPPHGACTLYRRAGSPHSVLGCDAFDTRRVAAPGRALCGRVPRADGRVAPRWHTPDGAPVCRLHALPFPHAGRTPVLQPHVPEDVQPPRRPGAPLRHETEQSPSRDAWPPARTVSGPAPPRRCPGPFPGGPRPTARCPGGRCRLRRQRVGGGAGTRRHDRRPPLAHDGTERRIVRPQDPAEPTACENGKHKAQTVKHVLLVNALLLILFRSATYGGRGHDKRMADATPSP